MPALILLRGLPGAGKTELAKVLASEKWPMHSVDDYFTDEKGNYEFRFAENHQAYRQCLEHTEASMQSGTEKIFVHNTFTMDWEIEPYFELAKKHGYQVHVLTVENWHGQQNMHGVSREQLQKMAEKYRVRLM